MNTQKKNDYGMIFEANIKYVNMTLFINSID